MHQKNLLYEVRVSSSTYKSEARASPPGLSILIIAALYLLDSVRDKTHKWKEKFQENKDAKPLKLNPQT